MAVSKHVTCDQGWPMIIGLIVGVAIGFVIGTAILGIHQKQQTKIESIK